MCDHYEDLNEDRTLEEDTAEMELARAEYDRAQKAPSLYNCLRCTRPLATQVNIADGLCDSCNAIVQNIADDHAIDERYNRYNDI